MQKHAKSMQKLCSGPGRMSWHLYAFICNIHLYARYVSMKFICKIWKNMHPQLWFDRDSIEPVMIDRVYCQASLFPKANLSRPGLRTSFPNLRLCSRARPDAAVTVTGTVTPQFCAMMSDITCNQTWLGTMIQVVTCKQRRNTGTAGVFPGAMRLGLRVRWYDVKLELWRSSLFIQVSQAESRHEPESQAAALRLLVAHCDRQAWAASLSDHPSRIYLYLAV